MENKENKKVSIWDRNLQGKEKVVAIIIAVVLFGLCMLSPYISPILTGWINFDSQFWVIAETVLKVAIFIGFFVGICWLAVGSVKDLIKTLKTVFGKRDN